MDMTLAIGVDLEREPGETIEDGCLVRRWRGCTARIPLQALNEIGPAEAKGDGCRSHHGAPQETVEAILDRLWPKIAECRTAKALGAVILAAGVEVKMKRPLALAARDRLQAEWTDRTVGEMLKPTCHSEKQRKARRERNRLWRANPLNAARNRERTRYGTRGEYANEYAKARQQDDPVFAIARRLRCRLANAAKAAGTGKVGKTFKLVGLTPNELAAHLERHFLPGMSWENRHLWDVDHVIPMAAFDLEDPEQQAAAMHWTNLQPLWKTENAAKGSLHEGKRHRHRKPK